MAVMDETDAPQTLQLGYTGVSRPGERQLQYKTISALTWEVQGAIGAHWGRPALFRNYR